MIANPIATLATPLRPRPLCDPQRPRPLLDFVQEATYNPLRYQDEMLFRTAEREVECER